jgi:hypothetical protein
MQTVHGIVEQMAISIRNEATSAPQVQRLRRTASPLVGLLKGQLGSISDLVSNMILVATRGANERARLRSLRECVASIRMQIEVSQKRVTELHMVVDTEKKTL